MAVNERESDTVDHVVLTESIEDITTVPFKLTVRTIGRSRIDGSV